MQEVVQEFTVGFYDSSGVFSIYMKKDDTNRTLRFHICDGADDYYELLSDGSLAIVLREQLPDGTYLPDIPVDVSAVDLEERSVTVPIVQEMVQQSGVAYCELVFSSNADSAVITTVSFKLVIDDIYLAFPSEETQAAFNTWTELYISIRSLESEIRTNEPIRIDNENERISNENVRIAAEKERERRVGEQVEQAHAYAVYSGSCMNIAGVYASDAEAYAAGTREGEPVGEDDATYHNNAKYYRDETQSIKESLNGTLRPRGTCLFADLPTIADSKAGDMWSILDEFTTTADFREGAGIVVPKGADIYLTVDGQWDVMAGAPVTGVKGDKETEYHKGNVNLTPANIGALAPTDDTKDNTVMFTSHDEQPTDKTVADGWTGTEYASSGETAHDSGGAVIGTISLKGASTNIQKVRIDNTEYSVYDYPETEWTLLKMPVKAGSKVVLYHNSLESWRYYLVSDTYVDLGQGTACYFTVPSDASGDAELATSDGNGYDTLYMCEYYHNIAYSSGWVVGLIPVLGEPEHLVPIIPTLSSGEKHSSLFEKISAMFMNVRKLWNTVADNCYAKHGNKTIPFKFGIDADGNYGYYKDGADTVTPFKTDANIVYLGNGTSYNVTEYKGWENFTAENFFLVVTGISASGSGQYAQTRVDKAHYAQAEMSGFSMSMSPSVSYDSSAGVVTVNGTGGRTAYQWIDARLKIDTSDVASERKWNSCSLSASFKLYLVY